MTSRTFTLERLDSPTGRMLIVTDEEERLRAVDWEDHEPRMQRLLRRYDDRRPGGEAFQLRESARHSPARRALRAYFDGELEALRLLPTATQGTTFQRAVWDALRRIPTGCTVSYGQLAVAIGRPTATRAVGLANGANPIAIVVPCHRVIGADDSLTGYGGGIDRKRWLLTYEGARLAPRVAGGRSAMAADGAT
jgi:methylated-DNA-[protein]-cysteine S-methyltransferase